MKPANSADSFKTFLAERGLTAANLSVPQLVDSMLAFYRTIRASNLANDPQADMLLFQWGVFDWGHGENFEIDLTRQFISAGAFDDDAISQLSCTAFFAPTPELRVIPVSNRWCKSVEESKPFAAFIHESAAYRAVSTVQPRRIILRWEKV